MKDSNKIISFIIKNKYPIVLFVITLITHWIWYFKFGIMTHGDWRFWYGENLQEFFSPNFIWTNLLSHNLGQVVSMITIYPAYAMYGFLAKIGFSYALAERIVFFFPASLISVFSSFFLIKKILKSEKAAFIGALLYSFNTYFLKIQNSHLTIGVAYALAPFVLLAFINLLEKKKLKTAIIFSLLFSLMGYYEMRIVYVLSCVLFLYFIFHLFSQKISKKDFIIYSKLLLLSLIIIFLLNSFWTLPLLNIPTDVYSSAAERGLFGNNFLDINYALTLFYPFWHKGEIIPFVNQEIPSLMWFLPIFAFSSLLFWKKNKNVLFFSFISLLGILLTKQVSPPFSGLYPWLYNNFPGFDLFREASKFFILIAFGYSVLLAFIFLTIFNLFKRKYLANIFFLLATVLLLLNSTALITGKINYLFLGRDVPEEYCKYKDFIRSQKDYFRTLWVPGLGRFGYYDSFHPVATVEMLRYTFQLYGTEYLTSLKYFFDDHFINKLSIKYVVLPYDSLEEGYYLHSPSKMELEKFLKNYDWLKRLNVGNDKIIVYENENYWPHIYSDSGLNYYQTNASEFGDFAQNQNLYLNSDLEKNDYLLDKLDNIIVPIEADPDKIAEMKLAVDKTTDAKEQKKLQGNLDLYAKNLFFKDFKLQIPVKANYKIYFKKDSTLANNANVGVKIGNRSFLKDVQEADKQGRSYFNQLELDEGEHSFKLYIDNVAVDAINSGDIVLSAENLAEPIKTPQLEYKQINPTKYIVNVHGASESFPLIFSESFHPGWKIYPVKSPTGRGLPLAEFNGVNIVQGDKFVSENNQGTIQNENLNGGKFYDLLFRKPVLDDKHLLINGFANAWWVDIEELEKKGIIKRKVDGIYDFSVIIEFEPQKYFYIGLLISGLTFLGCLGYLLYIFLPRVYNRSDNKKLISK